MKKRDRVFLAIPLMALSIAVISCREAERPIGNMQFVNPMIGTGAHYSADAAQLWGADGLVRKQKPLPTSKRGTMAGYDNAHDPGQCIPAVLEPHGMNCWVAQTEDTEQKGISPYYYADEEIQGFRGSHWIEGSMTQDYGSFTLMPLGGKLITNPLARGSRFSHADEVSTPAYYSVQLSDYGVQVEMTGSSRSAIFRLTYQQAGEVYLVVNPNSDEGQGRIAYDRQTGRISGSNPVHRIYQGKGQYAGFDGHFVVQIDKPILEGGVYAGDSLMMGENSVENLHGVGAWVKYRVEAGETVLIKAASSFTSIDGALSNLTAEIPDWNFARVRARLQEIWRERLGRIEAYSADTALLTQFYTSLYHASFLPRVMNDVDGLYPSFGGGDSIMHTDTEYFDDFSMWDTYRAAHPLYCLLEPERVGHMLQSLVEKYKAAGWLPIFPCWNSFTSEMIGDHCCSLVADAWFKGIRDFDIKTAYEALAKNAMATPDNYTDYCEGKGRRALSNYMKLGYIPVQDPVKEAYHQGEQTSRTLEYAYDDYLLGVLGSDLGDYELSDYLLGRAQSWRNVFNPATGWVDGRNMDGTFVGGDPFDFQPYITEGKPCQYSFYVPHDLMGLTSMMGGGKRFEQRLDSLFEGGHYWHGNEPCHQIAYLYLYAGAARKTQQWVRRIMQTEYAPEPDGLAGNDDAGQMSAWYAFSAMGFYPICPGLPQYAIGSPCFDSLIIHQPKGAPDFKLIAHGVSKENIYIQSSKFNGSRFDLDFLNHEDILGGGVLEFVMGN